MNKETKLRAGITKIALSGFQVFDEKTEFPISKINLLFGPNSAGKSAIDDAFSIVDMLKKSNALNGVQTKNEQLYLSRGLRLIKKSIVKKVAEENNQFILKLKSSWRKSGAPARYSQFMSIEMESSISDEDGEGVYINYPNTAEYLNCKTLSEIFSFHVNDESYDGSLESDGDIYFSYGLIIDNELILYFSEDGGSYSINCKHPSIKIPDFSPFFNDTSNIAIVDAEIAKNPNLADLQIAFFNEGIVRFNGIFGFSFLGQKKHGLPGVAGLGSSIFHAVKNKIEYEKAFEIFSECFQSILSDVHSHSTIPSLVAVNASRNIPTKEDLFIYDKEMQDFVYLIEAHMIGFTSCLAPSEENGYRKTYSKNDYIPYLQSDRALEKVNYFLAAQMFHEKGYFIGRDFEYLSYKNSSLPEFERFRLTFTQFYLASPDGTRFGFDEVGSGLGYVFPVLCVLAQNERQLVILQQPELHLHPALQASLGDVLIESSTSKTLMVESHSEHLLLRILKRIRQTHLQTSIAPELKINADDVSVLYFDPSPDGTTTVKRLRISEDGEFMDRWPRGFFGERDQELLDE